VTTGASHLIPSPRAGAVSRFGAFFVDALVLSATVRSAVWLLSGVAHVLRRFAPPVDLSALLVAVAPVIAALYFVAFWATVGQTPGKWLMGIKIVPIEGGRLTLRRSLLRLVGYVLSALPVYLGFLWILGPNRRGWHDRLARTVVIYVRRRSGPATTSASALRGAITREHAAARGPAPPRSLSPGGSRP
jgi:uncharacterized RDD family membrane protein YckC